MTLQEAIKMARSFRRPGGRWFRIYPTETMHFSYEELVADDWEIEELEVTITSIKLHTAIHAVYGVVDAVAFRQLCKKLGLDT